MIILLGAFSGFGVSETEISSTGLGGHGGARADGLSALLGVKGTGLRGLLKDRGLLKTVLFR